MGNLHLVTGYAGQMHVTAADHGSFVESVIRGGQFVTDAGSKFAASVISNNQIRVADGELIMQGRHVKLGSGSYVDVVVDNGAQGYYRNDLIVARYTKNADSGIESCDLVVVKGTAVENNPSDPACIVGDVNGGNAMTNEMPLYRVPLSGLTVGELVPLFTPQKPLFDSALSRAGGTMAGPIAMGGYKITGLGTPLASGDAVSLDYAQKNFAPAHESADHPGCYYRVVDGQTEWLNPPMVPGVEYRTVERWMDKPVFAKLVELGALPNAGRMQVNNIAGSGAFRMIEARLTYARSSGASTYAGYDEDIKWTVSSYGDPYVVVVTTTDRSEYNGSLLIKFCKS